MRLILRETERDNSQQTPIFKVGNFCIGYPTKYRNSAAELDIQLSSEI